MERRVSLHGVSSLALLMSIGNYSPTAIHVLRECRFVSNTIDIPLFSPIDLYQICVKKVNLVKHNRPYEIIHTC